MTNRWNLLGAVKLVFSLVTVAAFPVVEPEEPVTLPEIGLVTVRLASVPTEVREEARMEVAKEVEVPEPTTVPVRVEPAAVTVIGAEPSKATPLMV